MLLPSLAEAAAGYDVVVIGGGLGGMTAAKRLVDAGHSVLLAERQARLGGYATWFRRGDHIFDVALHAFPAGMAKTLRKYWSRELGERVIPLTRIRFENPEFSFSTTFSSGDFKRVLKERFAVPEAGSEAFFQACRDYDFFRGAGESTGEFLERHFPGRLDVARVLLETVTYATGTNLDDPAMVYAVVFSNFIQKGTCSFLGGTDFLLAEMQRLLIASGVDVAVGSAAEKIILSDGRIRAVRIAGLPIRAKAVVSNANLKATCLELADLDALRPDFAAEIRAVPLSASVAQVYLGVRPGENVPRLADILFSSREASYDAEAFRAFPPRSISYSFYYPDHIRPGRPGAEIVASMCANYEDWDNLTPGEYRDRKKILIQSVLADLSRHIPGIAEKLDWREAATPKTLERFTGHWRGASFGSKFPGYLAAEKLPAEIGGLFHCGSQGILMSGWLGSANCGALAAGKAQAYLGGEYPNG
ncbi:MAG: FAD-dependent oxidoreductase [Planctomycetota bacterium]|jgi:phytoene dehydrogenase-like protein|nr:FAD-dependent oxidoreductase [Planctomycetota bacterium]